MPRSLGSVAVFALLCACGGSSSPAEHPDSARPSCDVDVDACIKRCDGGSAETCADLGLAYARGPNHDPQRAARAMERACQLGERASCVTLGGWYARGENVGADPAHATVLYDRGCELGEAQGCFMLGVAYSKGEGVIKDQAHARDLLRRACSGGVADACEAQRNLDSQ